jgi:hypothetical protein
MAERDRGRIVRTPEEARAAVIGQHMRYVLASGTVGVAVLFVAVYLYFFA